MNRTSYASAYRRILILVLPGFLAAACAPLEPGPRGVGTRTYGRCGVTTLIDRRAGETSHALTCLGFADESPRSERPAMVLNCLPDTSVGILLYPGKAQLHSGQLINVRYRFNGRAPVEKTWFWAQEKQMAGTLSDAPIDNFPIDDFLRGMAARERLVFEVGDRRAAIPFTGDTTGAINDFQSRCATLKK